MPLRSSISSSLENSIDGPGDVGQASVPASRRLAHTHQPVLSQNRILIRFLRELVKTNRCPESGSRLSESRTTPASVSNDLRRSVAPAARYTRVLERKLSTGATGQEAHRPNRTRPREEPVASNRSGRRFRASRTVRPPRVAEAGDWAAAQRRQTELVMWERPHDLGCQLEDG